MFQGNPLYREAGRNRPVWYLKWIAHITGYQVLRLDRNEKESSYYDNTQLLTYIVLLKHKLTSAIKVSQLWVLPWLLENFDEADRRHYRFIVLLKFYQSTFAAIVATVLSCLCQYSVMHFLTSSICTRWFKLTASSRNTQSARKHYGSWIDEKFTENVQQQRLQVCLAVSIRFIFQELCQPKLPYQKQCQY